MRCGRYTGPKVEPEIAGHTGQCGPIDEDRSSWLPRPHDGEPFVLGKKAGQYGVVTDAEVHS